MSRFRVAACAALLCASSAINAQEWPTPAAPETTVLESGFTLTFRPEAGASFDDADRFELALLHLTTGETNSWQIEKVNLCDGVDPATGDAVCVATMNLGAGLYAFAVRVRYLGRWSDWSFTSDGIAPYVVAVPESTCSEPPTNLARECWTPPAQIIAMNKSEAFTWKP